MQHAPNFRDTEKFRETFRGTPSQYTTKQHQSYENFNLECGAKITKHKAQPKVTVLVKIVYLLL